MRKLIITVAALAALAVPTAAMADVSTNGTTRDANGYGVCHHIANFNDDFKGVGHLRSAQDRQGHLHSQSGVRTPTNVTVDTQGDYAPISNNG